MPFLSGYNSRLGDRSKTVSTTSAGIISTLAFATSDLWRGSPTFSYEGLYALTALNPTTYSDFTIIVENRHNDFGVGTTDYYSELTRFTLPFTTSSTAPCKDVLLQGWMVGDGGRLSIVNVSTANSTAGSSAQTLYFRVRKP